jgi:hypothetical protein
VHAKYKMPNSASSQAGGILVMEAWLCSAGKALQITR